MKRHFNIFTISRVTLSFNLVLLVLKLLQLLELVYLGYFLKFTEWIYLINFKRWLILMWFSLKNFWVLVTMERLFIGLFAHLFDYFHVVTAIWWSIADVVIHIDVHRERFCFFYNFNIIICWLFLAFQFFYLLIDINIDVHYFFLRACIFSKSILRILLLAQIIQSHWIYFSHNIFRLLLYQLIYRHCLSMTTYDLIRVLSFLMVY